MTSVAWLIYLANVSEGVNGVAIPWIVILSIAVFIGIIVKTVFTGIASTANDSDKKEAKTFLDFFNPFFKSCIVALILLSVVSALLPNRNAMYAIAAAQVGEKMVTSENVQGVVDDASKALRSWLKKQIEPEPKTEKK